MSDLVNLIDTDDEHTEDALGPTRAEKEQSSCAWEARWFSQDYITPDKQVLDCSIPAESIETFQNLIWNKPFDRMVPGYGLTPKELASISSEGRRGWLVTSHFFWLSRCINQQQNHSRFFVLDTTLRHSSLQKLMVTKTSSQVKQLIFVLSVGRQDDGVVFLGTDRIPGDHWSMVLVDIGTGVLTYCDTLGWPLPKNLLAAVVRYTRFLHLPDVDQITAQLAHEPNHEQHVCTSNCTNYPLQTCSDVCGIITMITIAIAALDKPLFELLLHRQQGNLYLIDPTQYSTYLRHVVLHWVANNFIDISKISLNSDYDPLALPRPPLAEVLPCIDFDNEPKEAVKRKIDYVSNGHISKECEKKKKSAHSVMALGDINKFILESVSQGLSSHDLVHQVNEQFSSQVKSIHENINKAMRDCYRDILFNEAVERHVDDPYSLKLNVRDLCNCKFGNPLTIFKNQGKAMEPLQKDDTVVGIQTSYQKEMMKTYGRQCICVDLVRRRDGDKFFLYTILVFVEGNAEVPVAWLITNRCDNIVLHLFFKTLLFNVGPLQTEIFIGDLGSVFYKSWCAHFPQPDKKMFCTSDVMSVLHSRLNTFIPDEGIRDEIEGYLQVVPLIDNRKACQHYVNSLLAILKPHQDFHDYFKERFVDDKLQFWASCYRVIPASKFIPFLTPFKITLEHLGLCGRDHKFTRVDSLLMKLLQVSRFLEYRLYVETSETRLLRATKFINQKHTNAVQDIDIYSSAGEDSWLIHQTSKTNSCLVLDTGIIDCQCKVRCDICTFCVHQYLCSCPEFLLSHSGCPHTHAVHTFRKMNQVLGGLESTSSSANCSTDNCNSLGAQLHIERLRRQGKKHLVTLLQKLETTQQIGDLKSLSEDLHHMASKTG